MIPGHRWVLKGEGGEGASGSKHVRETTDSSSIHPKMIKEPYADCASSNRWRHTYVRQSAEMGADAGLGSNRLPKVPSPLHAVSMVLGMGWDVPPFQP